MTNTKAFDALANPVRREIMERLSRGPRSVAEIERGLPVTQSAVSQHLKILREAKLVSSVPDGARNIYQIDPHGLGQIRKWLDQMWDEALVQFKREAERRS